MTRRQPPATGAVAQPPDHPPRVLRETEDSDSKEVATDGGHPGPDAFRIPTIEELDAIRAAYNLSQKELSRRAGMEPGRFHHILRNDVDPQTDTMRAFLETLQDAEPRGAQDVERTGPKPTSSSLTETLEETDADDVLTDGGSVQRDEDETGVRSVDGTERIKFADDLVPKVLNEEKDATVRYDGFEDIQVGDTLTAVTEDGAPFAELNVRRTASVLVVEAHSVLEVFGADYPSRVPQDVIDALNRHYDTGIRPGTTVQVLVFEVDR